MNPILEITDSTMYYKKDGIDIGWSVEIKDIILIAEYTSNEGPYVDDYFLVFVTIEDGKAYFARCSFYTDGTDAVLETLKEKFGITDTFGLLQSTEWTSRVMWPDHLAGKNYFQFTEVKPVSPRENVRKTLIGPQLEYKLAVSIQEYIEAEKTVKNYR
jgi:hypothetical protein